MEITVGGERTRLELAATDGDQGIAEPFNGNRGIAIDARIIAQLSAHIVAPTARTAVSENGTGVITAGHQRFCRTA